MCKILVVSYFALLGIIGCKKSDNKIIEKKTFKKEVNFRLQNNKIEDLRENLLITENGFKGIILGSKIDTNNTSIVEDSQVNGEGEFNGYKIKDKYGEKVGFILPLVEGESTVQMIEVYSPKYKTLKGIGVGATFEEVKKAYPNSETHGSEIEGRTSVSYGKLHFYLETYVSSYKVDEATIKPGTKVKYISIR